MKFTGIETQKSVSGGGNCMLRDIKPRNGQKEKEMIAQI